MAKFLSREKKSWSGEAPPEYVDKLRNMQILLSPGCYYLAQKAGLPAVDFDWDLFPIEFVEKFRKEECYAELKNRYLDICRKNAMTGY